MNTQKQMEPACIFLRGLHFHTMNHNYERKNMVTNPRGKNTKTIGINRMKKPEERPDKLEMQRLARLQVRF